MAYHSDPGVFLGFDGRTITYVFNLRTRKIERAFHVRFFENRFPGLTRDSVRELTFAQQQPRTEGNLFASEDQDAPPVDLDDFYKATSYSADQEACQPSDSEQDDDEDALQPITSRLQPRTRQEPPEDELQDIEPWLNRPAPGRDDPEAEEDELEVVLTDGEEEEGRTSDHESEQVKIRVVARDIDLDNIPLSRLRQRRLVGRVSIKPGHEHTIPKRQQQFDKAVKKIGDRSKANY
ncbi:hypothetical protein HK101_007189, partial [Irineochytrium annulatum]